jgi:hypothetical protein
MGRMMRNFIESDKAKELFKQVPPGTVEALAETNTPIGKLLKGSGVAYPQQQTQTYAPLVQLQQPLPPLQFDNPERAERIESSLGRAAFGPERIREILMQLKEANFLANGGRVGYQVGGVATPEQYAAALAKVSAGTQDQQNRSLAEYVQNSLGLTQKHFDTVNQMKQNPKQFGINSQFDYAKKSGADLVKNANPFTQPFVALGQGVASPIYDYGQALKKYSDKGYQGEFGLSTQGILDFGKNLLRVGQEFAEQKPIQMALGRTLGGAEAIREGISSLFTNPSQQATTSSSVNQPKYPDYKTTALQSQYYKNNPSNLDFDLFRAAYAKASSTPDSQIKTDITDEGQIVTHFGNWDPSRTYAAYMSNTGTSNSNPFFDQFKGSQYSNMPTVMEAMYGAPGNMNPYYANGGSVGVGSMFVSKR